MRPHGVILVATKEETRTKARGLVAAARATGSLTPTEAGSLFGKPRLVLCLGRVGLAPLHAIKRRQYASNTGHDWPLECALGEALDCILDLLYAPPFPAVLLCKSSGRRPVLVWSDAMWDPSTGLPFGTGQVGFVVKIPRDGGGYDVVFAESKVSLHVLARLHELRLQKTFIHGLELIGILAPYFCSELQAVFRDAFVIHFGDNTAANGAE